MDLDKPQVQRAYLPSRTFCVMAVICIAAAILRLVNLDRESFWFDEGFSISIAHSTLHQLWRTITAYEANMSLYYLALHFWTLFGESEFVVRSFSALAGLLNVPVIYLLCRQLSDKRTALIAAFLLATNTFHIQYSQEARSYSLTVLLTTLATLFLVRAIDRGRPADWTLYTVLSCLAPYCHFYALLVIGAQWISLPALGLRRVPWRAFCISASAIIVCCAPLGFYVLKGSGGSHLAWIPKPGWSDLWALLGEFAGSKLRLLVLVFSTAIMAAATFSISSWSEDKSKFKNWCVVLLFVWLLAPILGVFAISQLKPIFLDKYLIISLPPFLILASDGISRKLPPQAIAVLLVIVGVWEARSIHRYESRSTKEDWRGASSFILSEEKDDDGFVFFVPDGKLTFDYYARLERHTDQVGTELHDDFSRPEGHLEDTAGRTVQPPSRTWLVEAHLASPQLKSRDERLRRVLAADYRQVSERSFGGGIEVLEFMRQQP